MSVAEYVAGVDRLLTQAHGLFPAGSNGGGELFGAGGGGAVPAAPAGSSGLHTGAGAAGDLYTQAQSVVAALETGSAQTATVADEVGAQGRSTSGVIRDQARMQAAALAPMSNSAAGMRLLVATMDSHVTAMQNQLSTTDAQNQALTTRLRQVAAYYRGQGGAVNGQQPDPNGRIQALDTGTAPPPPGPQPFLPQWQQAVTAPAGAPPPPAAPPPPGPQPFLPQWEQAVTGASGAPPPPAAPMPAGGSPPPPPPPLGQCVEQRVKPDLGKHMVSDGFSNGLAGGLAGAAGGAALTPEVGGAGGIPGFVLGFVGGFAKGAFEAPFKETGKGLFDCLTEEAGQ